MGNQKLGKLVDAMTAALVETVRGIVDRPVEARLGALAATSRALATGGLDGPVAVIDGSLTNDLDGKQLSLWVSVENALTLAGLMAGKTDDDVRTLREGNTLEAESLEGFTEAGKLLVAGIDGVLGQDAVPSTGLEFDQVHVVEPGSEAEDLAMIEVDLDLEILAHPTVTIRILIDRDAADVWNGGAFAPGSAAAEPRPGLLAGDAPFEEIPVAEIRGKLAVYLHTQDVFDVVRRSCRRVGLEIDLHGHSEVPNPAAHKNQIVLMDVPPGEDRRYGWARRLKGYESNTSVVLVIQQPSKSRVLQGFLAKADAIVGWPLPEKILSQKLTSVLESLLGPAE